MSNPKIDLREVQNVITDLSVFMDNSVSEGRARTPYEHELRQRATNVLRKLIAIEEDETKKV